MPGNLQPQSSSSPPALIAISGGTGSGKSHLARELAPLLGKSTVIIALDHFYKDLGHLPVQDRADINFDHPEALDWPSICNTIATCRTGKACQIPDYDFSSHTRTARFNNVPPCDWYLFEGLWCWWEHRLQDLYDLRIFVDHAAQDRLSRRMKRDVRERGRTPESVDSQWKKQAEPMHRLYVQPQRDTADIVVSGNTSISEIQQLAQTLLKKLNA